MQENIGKLKTESRNLRTLDLDQLSTSAMVKKIVQEEAAVVPAVLAAQKELALAVNLYVKTYENDGRVIVVGSGCSGSHGLMDVEELLATFNQKVSGDRENDRVMALHLQRGWHHDTKIKAYNERWLKEIQTRDLSEDSRVQPRIDLETISFNHKDLLIVISASGRSPALVEMAKIARARGGQVVAIVMNKNTKVKAYANVTIEAITPPPPLTGSGRMLAGTASKIIITTLSTAAHTKLGAVHSNLMVNLNVKAHLDNSKFIDRATRMICAITKVDFATAKKALVASDYNIKVACVMLVKKVPRAKAEALLEKKKMILRAALS